MGDTTAISWCHHTASPWYVCTEVDPCCANCYARVLALGRMKAITGGKWGKGVPRVYNEHFIENCRKWNRAAERAGQRRRVFPSLCDPFDEAAPRTWFFGMMETIEECTWLDFLLLTKRVDAVLRRCVDFDTKNWPENIWIGASAGTQATLELRLGLLVEIMEKFFPTVIWLSAEPLLERLTFPDKVPLDWIVIGGESGSKRRDCGVEPLVDLANQADALKIPVWMKQDCARLPGLQGRIPDAFWKLRQLPTPS